MLFFYSKLWPPLCPKQVVFCFLFHPRRWFSPIFIFRCNFFFFESSREPVFRSNALMMQKKYFTAGMVQLPKHIIPLDAQGSKECGFS